MTKRIPPLQADDATRSHEGAAALGGIRLRWSTGRGGHVTDQLLMAHTAKIAPVDKDNFTLDLAQPFGLGYGPVR
jgi:hypothetical protein